MKEITKQMIDLAAKGDQYAIEQLYSLTYNSVYQSVKVLIRDEDTVLDILQDSYIKAFQSLAQLENPENFPAWVKRIAINKAKDHLKKKRLILFSEMADEDGEVTEFRDEVPAHDPELVMDRKETARLIREILDTLSQEQRLVIGMFYYEQMSVKQIAELLECSENTVKSRLNYGRKKIEAKVKELEKKGTKLYSLAPLPFLISLLMLEDKNVQAPSPVVWDSVSKNCLSQPGTTGSAVRTGEKAARSGAKAAAKTGANAASRTLAVKIAAAALAVCLVGGGVAAAIAVVKPMLQPEASIGDVVSSIEPAASEQTAPTQNTATKLPQQDSTAEDATLPTATEETTHPTPADPMAAYDAVLNAYREACGVESSLWLSDSASYESQYENLSGHYLTMHHELPQFQFYYCYHDLDGNGTQELLMGCGWEGDIALAGVYTFDGTQAIEWLDNNGILLSDGTLLLQDYENLTFTLYRLSADGSALEVVETQHPDSANAGQVWWQMTEEHGGFLTPAWNAL